ncbi:Zinc finger, BED-type [Heracleum sosnowskyi]|uniref:Zinc finger, BED-type n=1 Tax=Heracleum sosnowskyi TaxID=360622 RepID=A0AAD8MDZ1_9APIA|nr:Zinc finger, BED-type [Heracleum sosnowskyi]
MYVNEASQQEAAEQKTVEIEVVEDEEVIGVESDKQEETCDKKGKMSSKVWEYFDELKGCAIAFEKSKCKFCGVIIGCNTNRNGTSAMMNHLKTVCTKSPLRTNFDKLQKTLNFEKLFKDGKFQTLQPHTFDQEKLRKKLALMCIKDNQPFRIVEHEGFRELMNVVEPKFKMPSRWTVARDCLKIYSDELSKNKVYIIAFGVNAPAD